jgi:hypothetical protein
MRAGDDGFEDHRDLTNSRGAPGADQARGRMTARSADSRRNSTSSPHAPHHEPHAGRRTDFIRCIPDRHGSRVHPVATTGSMDFFTLAITDSRAEGCLGF